MKYTVDKSQRPVYLQIYRQIRQDIIDGLYPVGTKLPSIRLMCDELGVSTVTVNHAYGLLCDEGYAEGRERSGFVAIFRKDDSFAVATESATVKLPMEHGKRDYPDFPFSVLSRTMRGILTDYGEDILERSPGAGCLQLREAIRKYLARNRGISVSAEQIVIGSGSEYLYSLIIELLGKRRIFGIESPSYKKIEQVYRAAEVSYEHLPLSRDGIDGAALQGTGASVLHTTPYRSFPTGITATASKRHEYIRWARRGDRYIIEDDFESEFSVSTKAEETLFSLSEQENVIYLNTFSKTVSPSLRVGYMVLPARLAVEFSERLGFYSCTVPTFEQLVIAELINSGDFERHINRVRRSMRKTV